MAKTADKKPPTKLDLKAIGHSAAKSGAKPKCWLDDLDPDSRAQIIEFAKEFIITGGNRNAVVAAWQKAGIPVTKDKFSLLLNRAERGEI